LLEVTLGFIAPAGVALGGIEWEGCPTQDWTEGAFQACTDSHDPNGVIASVDHTKSFGVGPIPSTSLPPAGTRSDTLYVKLRGALVSSDFTSETLIAIPENVEAGDQITAKLGTINITAPGYPENGPPPVLTIDGVLGIAQHGCSFDCQTSAFLQPGEDPIGTEEVLLTGTGSSGADYDGDGWENDTDNCVFAYDPLQLDSGGILQTTANGRGDVCECGDLDGNGIVGKEADGSISDTDVIVLQESIAGLGHEDAKLRCSIDDDSDCDILDLVILQRSLAGVEAPPLNALCVRNVPAGNLGTDN